MPFIRCVFSGDPSLKLKLMASLSKALATSMGKPEAVVMCHVEHSSSLMFGGSVDPAAMINVESIGSDLVSIIPTLTEVMTTEGGIPSDRCFFNFRDVDAESWSIGAQTIAAKRAAL